MLSPELPLPPRLDSEALAALAALARVALVAAVRGTPAPEPTLAGELARPGASFVSLHEAGGALRGCVGTLAALQPLGHDVAVNARAAALDDLRFAPVGVHELDGLTLEISLLSPLAPLVVASRAELVAALVPGVDGLLLDDGVHRATFLPAVWRQLPEPERFLAQLERKAGLPEGGWSARRRVWRYAVASLSAGRVAGAGAPPFSA